MQAKLQLLWIFCPPVVQALRENLHAWWGEKNIDQRACHRRVSAMANGPRPLDINVHENIRAEGEVLLDRVLARAVEVAVDLRVFQKV